MSNAKTKCIGCLQSLTSHWRCCFVRRHNALYNRSWHSYVFSSGQYRKVCMIMYYRRQQLRCKGKTKIKFEKFHECSFYVLIFTLILLRYTTVMIYSGGIKITVTGERLNGLGSNVQLTAVNSIAPNDSWILVLLGYQTSFAFFCILRNNYDARLYSMYTRDKLSRITVCHLHRRLLSLSVKFRKLYIITSKT